MVNDAQAVRVAAISFGQTQAGVVAPIVVEPVAISGGYALADWTAGRKEGEVLLVRRDGKWHVVTFQNAPLADKRYLTLRYRVPPEVAGSLVTTLLAEEKRENARP